MLLGSLLFGAMLGLAVAVGALLIGLPVLTAVVVYVVVGTLAMILVLTLFAGTWRRGSAAASASQAPLRAEGARSASHSSPLTGP